MLNILSIDVEDYYHVSAFESYVRREDWHKYQSRVVDNTRKILCILRNFGVEATFFVLGWVAEHYPVIVKEIERDGHEVASHSYDHRLIYDQSIEEFREDVRKTKAILESIIPDKVRGYRATSYSITEDTLWALDVLLEEGFLYDSSIFPIVHDIYGIPNAKRFPHIILGKDKASRLMKPGSAGILPALLDKMPDPLEHDSLDNEKGKLWEFPLSTLRLLGSNIPVAGGGYLRLFPYEFTRWAIRKLNRLGYPAIVYMHPWEIDPHLPRLKGKLSSRFRQYINLDKTEKRLKALLRDFDFVPIRNFLDL